MPAQQSISPIYERFRQSAKARPDKVALVIGERRYSYQDLLVQVDSLADGFSSAKINSGEHIGVVLPNCAEFVIILLAAAKIGAVVVPQSLGLSSEALGKTFQTAHVRHLIIWSGAINNLGEDLLAITEGGSRLVVGESAPGWIPICDIQAAGRARPNPAPLISAEQAFLMVLTSGSTGQPKPILLSQKTKLLRAEAAVALYGVSTGDITLAATPLYHSLAQRLVLMPLISAGTSILMTHFTADQWIAAVDREKVSFSIAVSSQLKQILARLLSRSLRLESLRCIVSSSALLDNETKRQLLESLQCEFHECYGASEIAIASNLSPQAAQTKLGSVGTAIPGTNIKILGRDGQEVPIGAPGEITCSTPMLYSGYYNQAAITADAMWGDYFRTGDLGRMDEEGFLYFLGRIKDIIITGGVNIYPKDIEDIIATHPEISECAAIPLADDDLGEVVGVVIAFKSPANPPPIRDIQRLCMQHLGDFQQPRRFFIIPELPKNAMGKLDKPSLRQTYSTSRNPE